MSQYVEREELAAIVRDCLYYDGKSHMEHLADRLASKPAVVEGESEMPTKEDWLWLADRADAMPLGGWTRLGRCARKIASASLVVVPQRSPVHIVGMENDGLKAERDAAIARAMNAESALRDINGVSAVALAASAAPKEV